MSEQTLRITIAGNPNCGKTTLFNALTGMRQRVGNWPGVTVERVVGEFQHGDMRVEVTDLPGIYSLSAYSIDETVARRHILDDKPDVVVNILDATNLERNLYLTTQLLEMRVPMIVALNMVDVAKRRRIRIETQHLARHLGCPVIPIVASRGTGVAALKEAIVEAAARATPPQARLEYDSELEKALIRLQSLLAAPASRAGVDPRWLALKAFEGDEIAAKLAGREHIETLTAPEIERIEKHVGEAIDIVIADGRYGFIHGLALDVVHRPEEVRRHVSDVIDNIALNRVLGIPFFLGVMYVVFMLTIQVGSPFVQFFELLFGTIFVDGLRVLLAGLSAPAWLITLLADGLGGGLQTVATFVPPIFMIFLCLSILEDSGYMARAAFVMDRMLRVVGLPGKAFIPMLVGFGCNVPAILAARTLDNRRDRILTILMNPFMSCGARLPVYTFFTAAFFPRDGGAVLFGLYIAGIVLAIATGMLFKRTILQGTPSTFVMELPPYHLPTLRGILYHTGTRLSGFMFRAGKVILGAVAILSILGSVRIDGTVRTESPSPSVLSMIGRGLAPALRPMGITNDNWPAAVGLLSGFFAKEAVVGTLDTLYARMDTDAREIVSEDEQPPFDFWNGILDAFRAIPEGFRGFSDRLLDPLGVKEAQESGVSDATSVRMRRWFDGRAGAMAYLLFVLIYAPCVAVIAAIYREAGRAWALFSVAYLTGLAWVVSTVYYQVATFHRHPARSMGWLAVCVALALAAIIAMKRRGTADGDAAGDEPPFPSY